MRNLKYMVVVMGLAVMAFSSCRSTKQAAPSAPVTSARTEQIIRNLNERKLEQNRPLTAKVLLQLELDGKKMSVGGNLRMKRNEVIQLTASVLFAEVGRIEFTPAYMLLLDRMGKQYVKVGYDEVPFLKRSGLDFYSLQALFWNELFVPGKQGALREQYFTSSTEDGLLQLVVREASLVTLRFALNPSDETLVNTRIASSKQGPQHFDWHYLHFNKGIADKMELSMAGIGKDVRIGLTLSNIRNNGDWELTQIPEKKYKRVDPVVLFKKLLKIG